MEETPGHPRVQMFREIIHLQREPGETVRDAISRVNGKLNRLEAVMEERSIDLHKLLRKNRLLEILGDDYPSLKEHLFLTAGSTHPGSHRTDRY